MRLTFAGGPEALKCGVRNSGYGTNGKGDRRGCSAGSRRRLESYRRRHVQGGDGAVRTRREARTGRSGDVVQMPEAVGPQLGRVVPELGKHLHVFSLAMAVGCEQDYSRS